MDTRYSLIFNLLLIGLDVAFSDLRSSCMSLDFNKHSLNQVFPQSTPYANLTVSSYKKVTEAETLSECIEACCEDSSCNLAFLFNTICYSIECPNYKQCKPFKRTGKKFERSFVVMVRVPGDGYYSVDLDDNDKIFEYPVDGGDDDKDSSEQNSEDIVSVGPPKACVYGVSKVCLRHEECAPKNSRARSGLCQCIKNYERDVHGICRKKHSVTYNSPSITVSPTTLSQGSLIVKNSTNRPLSTTASPVHKLVVSAGDNITLQLPENEVTLSAYAIKQEGGEDENYKYEWTLISHPEGDETGTMQDQNTKNLKLSKVF